MNKLIQKYNNQETLIMVSLYPKKGELYSAGTSGVASYAKNVAKNINRKVIVLANKEGKKKEEIYEEGNVLVFRCFKINTPLMWFQVLKNLRQFKKAKTVLIQLDFAVYGSVLTTSAVLPFLLILKLLGYKTTVTMHHVVLNVFKLKGHVGLGNGISDLIKGLIYNVIFYVFYVALGLFAKQIVVLEEALKKRLSKVIFKDKIIAISHGVDNNLTAISKNSARKILKIDSKEYIILLFGFVNWFKGTDYFVDTFKDIEKILGKKSRFIIAGGKSPTMQDKPYYQKYYSKIIKNINSSKKLQITGYVSQEKIAAYFSASDLVVFPYRDFMTASGVLSLVFSYKRPFILSEELGEMFNTKDFQQALKLSGLSTSDLVFKLNKESFLKVTEKVLVNGLKPKMISMTEIVKKQRDYNNVSFSYEKVLFKEVVSVSNSPALEYV